MDITFLDRRTTDYEVIKKALDVYRDQFAKKENEMRKELKKLEHTL